MQYYSLSCLYTVIICYSFPLFREIPWFHEELCKVCSVTEDYIEEA